MMRRPILRMPRVLRGTITLPSAPDYGKPKKLDYFMEANGNVVGAGSKWKIMDYGGLVVIEHRMGDKTYAQIFESTSGLLVVGGSLNISGKVRPFRSAVAELNTFADWEKANGGLDKWQMHTLAGKVRVWLDTLRGI